MRHRVLVVEEDATDIPQSICGSLGQDTTLTCVRTGWAGLAPETLGFVEAELIILVTPSHRPEVEVLFDWLKRHPVPAPVFAVIPAELDDDLFRLISRTADDFILTPVRPLELRRRLSAMLTEPRHDLEIVRRRLLEEIGITQLVGKDPVFLKAIEQVPRYARADVPVLIAGETGTGKELCARALHHLGRRGRHPFIAVDCGALPDQLFENELFGHARGAFTDAHRDHKGLVAIADGGTLFLDEVDSLSLGAQGKLLRFLQERTFRPLGSDRFHQADVNIISATNRDLCACTDQGQFRQDLYFRLNVLSLHLPALRERRDDIELIARHELRDFAEANGTPCKSLSAGATRLLVAYDWPGNVRELGNVVRRAIVAADGEWILPEHLSLPLAASEDRPGTDFRSERAAAVAAFERRYVEGLLRKHRGNVTHAAREARQDRRAFGRFIKKYKIDRLALIS
jgi:DNA-binding NtrC family response regulator